MITTTLFGGLGNQMFIYAMVRALSLRLGVPMGFNLTNGFVTDHTFRRNLELSHFALSLPEAPLRTFDYGQLGRVVRKVSRALGFNMLFPLQAYCREREPYGFQAEMAAPRGRELYLEGYWQSPAYFEDCAEVIRQDFQLRTPMPEAVEAELAALRAAGRPLVMVGVRRYQECKQASYLTEHLCDERYFERAMALVAERVERPLFVVFSQDREWVERKLPKTYDLHFAAPKTGELSAIADFYLMQHCDHAIISNSTFYWWGAWMQAQREDHIVVAPDNFMNPDSPCREWTVLSV